MIQLHSRVISSYYFQHIFAKNQEENKVSIPGARFHIVLRVIFLLNLLKKCCRFSINFYLRHSAKLYGKQSGWSERPYFYADRQNILIFYNFSSPWFASNLFERLVTWTGMVKVSTFAPQLLIVGKW